MLHECSRIIGSFSPIAPTVPIGYAIGISSLIAIYYFPRYSDYYCAEVNHRLIHSRSGDSVLYAGRKSDEQRHCQAACKFL